MPLDGLHKILSFRISYLIFSILVIAVSLFSAASPTYILAQSCQSGYHMSGTQCRFYYGNTSGNCQSMPVDNNLCGGGGGSGSVCNDLVGRGKCESGNVAVPGAGSLQGCYPGGEVRVSYQFGNGPNNPPTGILFDAGCDTTWSIGDGGNQDLHLNIEYLAGPNDWDDIRPGNLGSQEDYKIENGDSSKFVPMSMLRSPLTDYTTDRAFIFYPNCGGKEDSIEATCYRTSTLRAWTPPPPPPCTMPLEQVSYLTSCTPAAYSTGYQRSQDVVQALNLNRGTVNGVEYCSVDYVNISTYQNPTYPNYWNAQSTGASTKNIPLGFRRAGTSEPLALAPSTTYWISYYDSESGQLSGGRSFTTRAACPTPSAPVITQGPQCRFYIPYEAEPRINQMYLRWNRPSFIGEGFTYYEMEASTTASSSGRVIFLQHSSNGSLSSESWAAGATAFGLNPGTNYYYRVRGVNWGGPGTWSSWTGPHLLKLKPGTPTGLTGQGFPISGSRPLGSVSLDWNYSSSTAPTNNGWENFFVSRAGPDPDAQNTTGVNTAYTDNFLPQCNDSVYRYTVWGSNVCGGGPSTSVDVRCPINRAPSCEAIQYSENNGASWANYPTGSGGLTRNRATRILLRRSCTDPELNNITYSWSTSPGCGSFNPSTQTLTSSSSNPSVTTFTFSSNYNTSCDLTSTVRDSNDSYVTPNAVVVAKTWPLPQGTHSLSVGSRSIQRSTASDSYAVIGGQTQNTATMTHTIANYSNPTAQGSSTNRPGTLTINTTSTTISGVANICHSSYGTCTFAATGTTSVSNITSANSSYPINIQLNSTHVANMRDILVDAPSVDSNLKYRIQTNFSSTAANGDSISSSPIGTPNIINNAPLCAGLVFNPPSPFGLGDSNINIRVNARDDWGLRGIRVDYAPFGSSSYQNIYDNATYFNSNSSCSPSATCRGGNTVNPAINWNVSGLTAGRYQVRVQITDADDLTTTCLASNNMSGGENGGTPSLPEIVKDTSRPVCDGAMVVTPNSTATALGFNVRGLDNGTSNTASGLSTVNIAWRYGSTGAYTSHTTYNIEANAGYTRNYAYDIPSTNPTNHATHPTFNLTGSNRPSGPYEFLATWTDRAGNTGSCTASYEKGSRISGEVRMVMGPNGTDALKNVRVEADGITLFDPETQLNSSSPVVDAAWGPVPATQNCTSAYPGNTHSGDCTAYFTSNAEFAASSNPRIRLHFPTVANSGTPAMGKYRCTMTLYNATSANRSAWTTIRTVSETQNNGDGNGTGSTGVCTFNVRSGEIVVNPSVGYGATSRWPTYVSFQVEYNTDKIHGQVRNEAGGVVPGTVSLRTQGGTLIGSGTNSISGYSSPASADPATYLPNRTDNALYTATFTPTVTEDNHLCVWAARNNFTGGNANNDRINALTQLDEVSEIQNLAQNMSLSGWTVGVGESCQAGQASALQMRNGQLSPNLQNQVNFAYIPKVRITGRVYLLPSETLCTGTLQDWEDNHIASENIPVDILFNSSTTGTVDPANNPLVTNTVTVNTGETFDAYVNSLPAAGSFANWQLDPVIAPQNDMYSSCSLGGIDAGQQLLNADYPSANTITFNVAVKMKETNDWWQTYHGGAHAPIAIANAIPIEETIVGESASFDMHTIVGIPDNAMYTSGLASIKNNFRSLSTTSALVSTKGNLAVPAGRTGANWRIADNVGWRNPNMKAVRIPIAGDETATNEFITKISTSSEWAENNLDTLQGGGNSRVFVDGPATIGGLNYGVNNMLIVNGDLDIDGDLVGGGSPQQSLFIIATGNVTISEDVSGLDAFIYSKGNIVIESAGQDTPEEKQLKVYGGLYADGNISMGRDIENAVSNYGYPSTQVIFNPYLILLSRQGVFPSQLKESNVYWTQE